MAVFVERAIMESFGDERKTGQWWLRTDRGRKPWEMKDPKEEIMGLLKNCAKSKDIHKGIRLHGDIEKVLRI